MHKRVLITGGAGFVGSSIAIALKRGAGDTSVIALDNLHRPRSALNLDRLRQAGVEFQHGDVRFSSDLARLRPAPELIIECSAETSVQAGYGGSPRYLMDTNLTGCYHTLELAREVHADILFLSTSRVYPYRLLNKLAFTEEETRYSLAEVQTLRGASGAGVNEDFPLGGPRSLYGMTKLASELMLEEYADAYGLRCIVNRCGLIAGPWQMGRTEQGVIAYWVAAHHLGRPLRYIGFGGKQVRDALHIDDLCELLLDQLARFDAYSGRPFNVGGGRESSVSLRELTMLCREVTGRTVPIAEDPHERPADVRIYLSDNTRITAVNGWKPRRGSLQIVSAIHDWIRGPAGFAST